MDCQRENLLFAYTESSCIHAGIYIHIPFCIKKCPYCDFYSVSDLSFKSLFVSALLKELRLRSDHSLQVDTIYLGGGTPSLLTFEEVDIIISEVANNFRLMDNTQITMEVNPGTVADKTTGSLSGTETGLMKNGSLSCYQYLSDIKNLGINRLSVGVQSFQDEKLRFLNRIHSADAARKTIVEARNAGFKDIGLDLIYGLPEESAKTWLNDLDEALQYRPEHLSCYMLSYEPDTPMFAAYKKGAFTPLKDDKVSTLFALTSRYLVSRNFFHYEISNFAATEQHQSRHNKKYWEMTPYLGFGPSAHSYDGKKKRSWNAKSVHKYISMLEKGELPVVESEFLTNEQRLIEMIMLGLRTDKGIDIESFEKQSKSEFELVFKGVIERIDKKGWGKIYQNHKIEDRINKNKITQNKRDPKENIEEEQYITALKSRKFILTLEGKLFLDTIIKWFIEAMDI